MRSNDYIFVDIETTGGHVTHDGITEVAWIHVSNGKEVNCNSQLLNPQGRIPAGIQQLTGITNEMVRDCPTFADIAPELHDILQDKIFVAHNARFDYGFLKNAFKHCHLPFNPPVLCTVKLSRRLYPMYRRHNLDSLIERHQLQCDARHRAMGDAQALQQFMQHVWSTQPETVVTTLIQKLLKKPALPPHIDGPDIDALPEHSGVYLFYGDNEIPLYVGKSVNLRRRILSHFSADHQNAKDQRISQQLKRIEIQPTAGELGALLKESQLVKQLQPILNRRLRRCSQLFSITVNTKQLTETQPEIVPLNQDSLASHELLCGIFKSRNKAKQRLRDIADQHRLCPQLLGLESGNGPCFSYQLQRCSGACCGKEDHTQHQLRLMDSLLADRIRPWPFNGPIAIREISADAGLTELHVLDRWMYLGSFRTEEDAHQLDLFETQVEFDLDCYRIISRYMQKHYNRLDIIPLHAACSLTDT